MKLWKILHWINPFNWFLFGIVDPCSLDEMETGTKCLIELPDKEKLAAEIWYKMQELDACGGVSYTFDSLEYASACLQEVSDKRLMAIEAYNAYLSALGAGASLTGTMDEIQTAIKCVRDQSPHDLYAMKVFIDCQLRECVTAPIIT